MPGEEADGVDASAFRHCLVDDRTLIRDLNDERTHGREVGTCRLDVAAEATVQASPATARRDGAWRLAR